MSLKATIDAFEAWRGSGEAVAMVTVIRTEGSTYSKPGHRILIAANGDYQGLVSGGCLEGDLAAHAREVIETGMARKVLYDLRDEADEVWGMGIGCNGMIEVLLQRLDRDRDYEPFTTIARCALEGLNAVCSVVTASDDARIAVGETRIDGDGAELAWQVREDQDKNDEDKIDVDQLRAGHATPHALLTERDGITVFHSALRPVPRLLVIGAGPDAVPLVRMAAELGWLVTVADHRQAYLDEPAFAAAEHRCLTRAGELGDIDNPEGYASAVIMTHHLDTDRAWLDALAATGIGYIGLLGPPARRDRLVDEIDNAALLGDRLHAPVGLAIGADGPESIALSILAEMQAFQSAHDST
ncbi:MAG: XdhC family protein [Gammaproteobacteria bacterium]|nr:XdhC family protein [Gammaproteobacteria bacterium]